MIATRGSVIARDALRGAAEQIEKRARSLDTAAAKRDPWSREWFGLKAQAQGLREAGRLLAQAIEDDLR